MIGALIGALLIGDLLIGDLNALLIAAACSPHRSITLLIAAYCCAQTTPIIPKICEAAQEVRSRRKLSNKKHAFGTICIYIQGRQPPKL